MKAKLSLGLFILCCPMVLWAHGPTPQKANESVLINAPIAKVWELLRKFEKISLWHPDLKDSLGDGKKEEPRVRTLVMQNNEQVTEEMDFFSDQDHEYGYRLKTENVKALPVSSYTVKIQATPGEAGQTTVVSAKSRFYRGDTGNTPPESLNDEAATKAMSAFFKNGLQGLKQTLEK
ncbi:MAG: SRPBCC family protein [Methylococcaceae bacterium]|jgi:mxaD protein